MIGEKIWEAGEAAVQIATGVSYDEVIRDYRHKVRANARRLARR